MIIRSALTALALVMTGPALAQDAAATDTPQAEQVETVPDIFLGAEDAPLTIYEYASFTCGHCANFHAENFPRLKAEYIDTGKVRFAQRDIYFDAPGLWAGIIARCDGDAKFYGIADILFDEQRKWLDAGSADELAANLRKVGLRAGMTEDQMNACWEDSAKVEQLVATFKQNATADEIDATPTFMIGGEKVNNQSWEDMKAIIDRKLAEAGQ